MCHGARRRMQVLVRGPQGRAVATSTGCDAPSSSPCRHDVHLPRGDAFDSQANSFSVSSRAISALYASSVTTYSGSIGQFISQCGMVRLGALGTVSRNPRGFSGASGRWDTDTMTRTRATRPQAGFLRRHALSLAAIGILLSWVVLYVYSDRRHMGVRFSAMPSRTGWVWWLP